MIVGLVGGAFVEGLWLIYFSRRAGLKFQKPLKAEISLSKQIGKQYLATLIGFILICAFPFINSVFAARLAPGNVAYLSYGEKLTSFFLMFLLSIFGTAVLPYISKAISCKKYIELLEIIKFNLFLIFFCLFPVSILLSYFSPQLVDLVFFTNSFAPEDKVMISSVQSILLLQMSFYSIVVLLTRMVIALKRNHYLLYVNIGALIFKITTVYYLSLLYGVQGIAASTPLTLLFMSCALGAICFNLMKETRRSSHVTLEMENKEPAYSL
jgi:putative peptidoglycan lipid II flippase